MKLSSCEQLLGEVLALQKPSNMAYKMESAEAFDNSFANLEAATAGCTWEESTPARYWFDKTRDLPGMSTSQGSLPYNLTYGDVGRPVDHMPTKICRTTDEEGRLWMISRVGPFQGTGGFDWHDVLQADAFDLKATLQQAPLYLTGAFSGMRGEDLAVIGYPPVHLHHSHIQIQAEEGWVNMHGGDHIAHEDIWTLQHVLLNHQDVACPPELGGEKCHLVSLPADHAIRVDRPLYIDTLCNDVRPDGSPPLTFYYDSAIRYTMASPRHHVHMWKTESKPAPYEHPFGTFYVPDAESAVWAVSKAPYSGRMLNLWIHAHVTAGLQEVWYITASPEELGLRTIEQRDRIYQPLYPPKTKYYSIGYGDSGFAFPECSAVTPKWDSVADLKIDILTRMKAKGLRFRCIATTSAYDLIFGDRQPPQKCYEGSDVLVAGQSVTSVIFFNPRKSEELKEGFDPEAEFTRAFQHFHYQGYTVPEGGSPSFFSTYNYAFPRDDEQCSFEPGAPVWKPAGATMGLAAWAGAASRIVPLLSWGVIMLSWIALVIGVYSATRKSATAAAQIMT